MTSTNGNRNDTARCVARLDRLIVTVRMADKVPTIPGYKVIKDTRVQRQGAVSTYERVRQLESSTTGSQIFIQYKPLQGFLPDQRIMIVGDDRLGITPDEIERVICPHFRSHKVSLAEIALDFTEESGVDEEFVLRYGRFGKARRRKDRGGPDTVRYGSRGSLKLVRCYWKAPLRSYRTELELHSQLLRKYSLTHVGQLYEVASKLAPGHLCFVRIDWDKLEPALRRRYDADCAEILAEARRRSEVSLRSATRYLGGRVPNVYRYLKSLRINIDVRAALKEWAGDFYQLEQFFPVANAGRKSKPRRVK